LERGAAIQLWDFPTIQIAKAFKSSIVVLQDCDISVPNNNTRLPSLYKDRAISTYIA